MQSPKITNIIQNPQNISIRRGRKENKLYICIIKYTLKLAMKTRFKTNAKIFDIVITAVGGTLSVGVMIYAIFHFGLSEAWPELVLNLFYIACLVMIWMYFFNSRHITTQQFNYWCSVSVGITVLLRDILFAPPWPTTLSAWPVSRFRYCCSAHSHSSMPAKTGRAIRNETSGRSVSSTC